MARGWQWQDLLGLGNITGNDDPIMGSLSGANAITDAAKAQQEALKKAFDVINSYGQKSLNLQAPYLQNAGQDFARQKNLVQSGYYQTPYNQSFTPQQNKPQGFSFNPSMGGASFTPQKQQGLMGYTPQGLPPMPQTPAYQAPNMNMGLMGGDTQNGGQPLPGLQGSPNTKNDPLRNHVKDVMNGLLPFYHRGKGFLDQIGLGDTVPTLDMQGLNHLVINPAVDAVTPSLTNALNPLAPVDPVQKVIDAAKIPSTGSGLVDAVIDPRTPAKLVNKGVKKAKKLISGLF